MEDPFPRPALRLLLLDPAGTSEERFLGLVETPSFVFMPETVFLMDSLSTDETASGIGVAACESEVSSPEVGLSCEGSIDMSCTRIKDESVDPPISADELVVGVVAGWDRVSGLVSADWSATAEAGGVTATPLGMPASSIFSENPANISEEAASLAGLSAMGLGIEGTPLPAGAGDDSAAVSTSLSDDGLEEPFREATSESRSRSEGLGDDVRVEDLLNERRTAPAIRRHLGFLLAGSGVVDNIL